MSVDSGGDFGVFVDIYSEAAGRTVGMPGVNAEGAGWIRAVGARLRIRRPPRVPTLLRPVRRIPREVLQLLRLAIKPIQGPGQVPGVGKQCLCTKSFSVSPIGRSFGSPIATRV